MSNDSWLPFTEKFLYSIGAFICYSGSYSGSQHRGTAGPLVPGRNQPISSTTATVSNRVGRKIFQDMKIFRSWSENISGCLKIFRSPGQKGASPHCEPWQETWRGGIKVVCTHRNTPQLYQVNKPVHKPVHKPVNKPSNKSQCKLLKCHMYCI